MSTMHQRILQPVVMFPVGDQTAAEQARLAAETAKYENDLARAEAEHAELSAIPPENWTAAVEKRAHQHRANRGDLCRREISIREANAGLIERMRSIDQAAAVRAAADDAADIRASIEQKLKDAGFRDATGAAGVASLACWHPAVAESIVRQREIRQFDFSPFADANTAALSAARERMAKMKAVALA